MDVEAVAAAVIDNEAETEAVAEAARLRVEADVPGGAARLQDEAPAVRVKVEDATAVDDDEELAELLLLRGHAEDATSQLTSADADSMYVELAAAPDEMDGAMDCSVGEVGPELAESAMSDESFAALVLAQSASADADVAARVSAEEQIAAVQVHARLVLAEADARAARTNSAGRVSAEEDDTGTASPTQASEAFEASENPMLRGLSPVPRRQSDFEDEGDGRTWVRSEGSDSPMQVSGNEVAAGSVIYDGEASKVLDNQILLALDPTPSRLADFKQTDEGCGAASPRSEVSDNAMLVQHWVAVAEMSQAQASETSRGAGARRAREQRLRGDVLEAEEAAAVPVSGYKPSKTAAAAAAAALFAEENLGENAFFKREAEIAEALWMEAAIEAEMEMEAEGGETEGRQGRRCGAAGKKEERVAAAAVAAFALRVQNADGSGAARLKVVKRFSAEQLALTLAFFPSVQTETGVANMEEADAAQPPPATRGAGRAGQQQRWTQKIWLSPFHSRPAASSVRRAMQDWGFQELPASFDPPQKNNNKKTPKNKQTKEKRRRPSQSYAFAFAPCD
jgi:hypothetical protein